MRFLRRGTAGQAAVETAIVMPMFVFLLAGLMQMTLLYQSRSLVKYAAYRAARAGALNHACEEKMRKAALSVLLPVTAYNDSYQKTNSTGSYLGAYFKTGMLNRYLKAPQIPIVQVRICGPLEKFVKTGNTMKPSANEVDFDDPRNVWVSSGGKAQRLADFERTKLRIQVKFFQQMIIPFANSIIFRSWMGLRLTEVVRMNSGMNPFSSGKNSLSYDQGAGNRPKVEDMGLLLSASMMKRYFMPLYANYTFRMQSNFFLSKCKLPQKNECFHYVSSGDSDGAP
jgi:hypothetical protein